MMLLRSLLAVFLLFPFPLLALDAPQGTPVLTVTGAISRTNADGAALFDRAMLEALDWRDIETATYFTEGTDRYAGPTLASLLAALGVTSGTLRATAVNDYTVDIPVAHARDHDVLLAMDHDGSPMRVRDKGPIWVIYPVDAADLAKKEFENFMIWQLVRIDVQP